MMGKTKNPGLAARRKAFLAAFAVTASVHAAGKAAGIDPCQHYRWMQKDPAYAAEFEAAVQQAAQVIEDEAVRRAIHGVEEPVVYRGAFTTIQVRDPNTNQFTGERRILTLNKKSDALLQTLLKAWLPRKYRETIEANVTTTERRFSGTLEELLALYRRTQETS